MLCLSEHCHYGNSREEMIRDRIVVGLRDSRLSEKLQLEADLTLEKALAFARQRESVKSQQKVITDSSPPNVDAIQSCGKLKDKRIESKPTRQTRKMNPVTNPEMCTKCEKCSHVGEQQCLVHNAIC